MTVRDFLRLIEHRLDVLDKRLMHASDSCAEDYEVFDVYVAGDTLGVSGGGVPDRATEVLRPEAEGRQHWKDSQIRITSGPLHPPSVGWSAWGVRLWWFAWGVVFGWNINSWLQR